MKFLGVTDEITTCQKCGKQHLKRTVVIALDDDQVVHYGTDCAAKALSAATAAKRTTNDLKRVADMLVYAEKLAALYQLEMVRLRVWNRFGYSGEIRGDVLKIQIAGQAAKGTAVYAEIRPGA